MYKLFWTLILMIIFLTSLLIKSSTTISHGVPVSGSNIVYEYSYTIRNESSVNWLGNSFPAWNQQTIETTYIFNCGHVLYISKASTVYRKNDNIGNTEKCKIGKEYVLNMTDYFIVSTINNLLHLKVQDHL